MGSTSSKGFEASRRRFQDRFCARRQREPGIPHEPHCRGGDCSDFAPPGHVDPLLPFSAPPRAPSVAALHAPSSPQPPLVSCLMPTCDRRRFVPAAIQSFLRQDYEPRELVIVDDGRDPVQDLVPPDPRIRYLRLDHPTSLGEKRNRACEAARGALLAHWDDDDWHAPWRLSYQVSELAAGGADLCGLDNLWFYDPAAGRAWQYRFRGRGKWLAGGTFCFRRGLWEERPFPAVNVGEDAQFVRAMDLVRVLPLSRSDFYLARLHAGNAHRTRPGGLCWFPAPVHLVRRMLGNDFDPFAALSAASADGPLVSCVMPTYDRPAFVPLALRHFAAQTWPRRELVVVDDGTEPIEHLVAGQPGVRYVRCDRRLTLGAKRALGVREARGEIIVQWDDDDWYAPDRIGAQVRPIVAGRADLSGLVLRYVLELETGALWQPRAALLGRLFALGLAAGTLAFRRGLLERASYPEVNVGEDVGLLRGALRAWQRLHRVTAGDIYVYVRHGRNTWQFQPGQAPGWDRIDPAGTSLPPDLLGMYQEAARQARQVARRAP